MSPSGIEDIELEKRTVVVYAVHSSENNVIGDVEQCECVHGIQPEHFVAYAYKQPDDSDGRYWLGTYDELDEGEEAVAIEYDRLGPFQEELEEDEDDGAVECPHCESRKTHFSNHGRMQGQHWRCDNCRRFFLHLPDDEEE